MKDFRLAFINVAMVILAIGIGMMSIDYAEERAPAVITLTFCLGIGFIWVRNLANGEQFAYLFRIFLISLVLRVVIGVAIHYMASYATFAEDDYQYDMLGWRISQLWKGEFDGDVSLGIMTQGSTRLPDKEMGYAYVVAVLYYIFDHARLVPKIFNCFVGSMSVVYLAKFGWEVLGERTGKMTGVLCAVFPSMVLWSSLALKDALATLMVIYVVWHAYRSSERLRPGPFIKIMVGLIILGQLRDYMFVLVGGCVIMSFFLKDPKRLARNYLIGMILLLLGFFALRYFGFGQHYINRASFESLDYYRKSLATGNSAIHVEADISSPGKALVYLPIGVAYFLFAPFPWSVSSSRQVFALPEVLAWYALFWFFIKGLVIAFREYYRQLAPAINVLILITLTYSLVEGNLGTAYRHRAQIFGFYLLITAVGLSRWRVFQRSTQKIQLPQRVPRAGPQPEL